MRYYRYHMFGPSIGRLNLYIKKYGKSDTGVDDWKLIWSRVGSQLNQ